MNAFSLIEHLSKLPDYRQPWKTDYKLTDILLLVTCAMITGAKSWKEIEDFGRMRKSWLNKMGAFPDGIVPSHDTIERVVSMVNPKKFHKHFSAWMQDCHKATEGAVVAIDGKTVRSSGDRKKSTRSHSYGQCILHGKQRCSGAG